MRYYLLKLWLLTITIATIATSVLMIASEKEVKPTTIYLSFYFFCYSLLYSLPAFFILLLIQNFKKKELRPYLIAFIAFILTLITLLIILIMANILVIMILTFIFTSSIVLSTLFLQHQIKKQKALAATAAEVHES